MGIGRIVSKASEKAKKDGPLSLISVGVPFVYTQVKNFVYIRFIYIRYRIRGYSAIAEPKKIICINPENINYYLNPIWEGSYRCEYGIIKGGSWDLDTQPIEDRPKYKACKQRVEDDISWESTGIIDYMAERLEKSGSSTIEHGCNSREDIKILYEEGREELYQSLKSKGFKKDISDVCCRVHIGREGELIFASGGRHRLYISRIIGIDEVPVRVLYRHKKWQSIREEFKQSESYSELSETARNHIDHPDLQEFVDEDWLQ